MVATAEDRQLFSTGEAARRLGISQSLLLRYEKEGRIPPAHRVIGSDRRLYSAEDLETIRAIRAAKRVARQGAAL